MSARTVTTQQTKGNLKKTEALRRFRRFLIWEGIASSCWMIEQGVSVWLKYARYVSLGGSPVIIFAIKLVQRGTEFIMMAFLAYLVCLKTASMDFTKNYRLPRFSIPILCGGGCCSSVPKDMTEEEFVELVDSRPMVKPNLSKQSSFLAKLREKRQEKKHTAMQEQNQISSFAKHTAKRKKDFGKVNKKKEVEMKEVKTKGTIADIYNGGDEETGSWGSANPMRGGAGIKLIKLNYNGRNFGWDFRKVSVKGK
jgi:hypothetical protein